MPKKIVTSFHLEVNNLNKIKILSEITGKNRSFLMNKLLERYIPHYLDNIEQDYIETQATFIKSRTILSEYLSINDTTSLFGKTQKPHPK